MTVQICSVRNQQTAGIVFYFLQGKGFHPSSPNSPTHIPKAGKEQRHFLSVPKAEAKVDPAILLHESGYEADMILRR
jgi:hypothetical protein